MRVRAGGALSSTAKKWIVGGTAAALAAVAAYTGFHALGQAVANAGVGVSAYGSPSALAAAGSALLAVPLAAKAATLSALPAAAVVAKQQAVNYAFTVGVNTVTNMVQALATMPEEEQGAYLTAWLKHSFSEEQLVDRALTQMITQQIHQKVAMSNAQINQSFEDARMG